MKNNRLKIILDIVLIALIATLFSKNAISLAYHETTGLVLFALFVVHLIFNRKWISGVFFRIFSGKFPLRTRITCLINLLLVLSWTMTIVTGILVSKILFPFHLTTPWIPLHFFFAAISLLLTGIHAGLHWTYLRNSLADLFVFPKKIGKGIAIAAMVVVLGFGCYTVAAGSYGQWISAPFSTSQHAEGGSAHSTSESASAGTSTDETASSVEGNTSSGSSTSSTDSSASSESNSTSSSDSTTGSQAASSHGGSAHGQQAFSLTRLLSVMAGTFSLFYLFMTVAAFVSGSMKKKKISA